ncbi:hypothetical protein STHU_18760 [Allostella humosa]|nr:hypothetical protein STHU_18760 [Stella humosa]
MIPERDPRFRKRGPARRSGQKLNAKLRFDPDKPSADDGLRDAEATRRGRYTPGIGHGDERLKILDVQIAFPISRHSLPAYGTTASIDGTASLRPGNVARWRLSPVNRLPSMAAEKGSLDDLS